LLKATHWARAGDESQALTLGIDNLALVDRHCDMTCTIEMRNVISRSYTTLGEPVHALPYALESLEKPQLLGDTRLISWAYIRLCMIYGALNYLQRSIYAAEKSIGYA
jgi:hypothetical protein